MIISFFSLKNFGTELWGGNDGVWCKIVLTVPHLPFIYLTDEWQTQIVKLELLILRQTHTKTLATNETYQFDTCSKVVRNFPKLHLLCDEQMEGLMLRVDFPEDIRLNSGCILSTTTIFGVRSSTMSLFEWCSIARNYAQICNNPRNMTS